MKKSIIHQCETLIPIFLTSFTTGLNYAWFAGNYKFFRGPDARISLSDQELSLLASMIHFGRLVAPMIMMLIGRTVGRKPVLVVSAIFMLAANGPLFLTSSVLILQISRVITGLSIGLADSVSLIYIGEVSSEQSRGLYCVINMSSLLGGLLVEFVLTTLLDYTPATIVLTAITGFAAVTYLGLVESPYHLAASNQPAQATRTIGWLRDLTEEQATAKLGQISDSLHHTHDSFFHLIRQPAVHRSFTIATSFGIITSLVNMTVSSNVNLILPSSTLLSSDQLAVIFSCWSAIAVSLSGILVHHFGRRTLLSWSFTLQTLLYGVTAILFYCHQKSLVSIPHFPWIMFAIITLSHFTFQLGVYSTTIAVRSEIYPHSFKIVANNVSVLCNAATNFVSTYTFLYFKEEFGMYMIFISFLVACLVGLFVTIHMLPETRGKTLEEIQKMLEGK